MKVDVIDGRLTCRTKPDGSWWLPEVGVRLGARRGSAGTRTAARPAGPA